MAITYVVETYVITDPQGSCETLLNDLNTLFYCQEIEWPSFCMQLRDAAMLKMSKIDALDRIRARELITKRIINQRTASRHPHISLVKPR